MTLKKIDHEFKNNALSYDATPNYQPCIKLSFFFNKKPEVSEEQFHRYSSLFVFAGHPLTFPPIDLSHWETVHADLTIAAKDFKACKIQRYVQFHQTADMKEKAKQLGLEHVAFDGCSEIWVRDWDDWMKFYSSPEYARVMQPDCAHFMAFPIHVMVGYDNLVYGHAIPGEGGKDGIMAETLQSK